MAADGRLTGLFMPDLRYRAIKTCDRPLNPYAHAAAATHREQWIVEIDSRGEDRFPDIPDATIRS